MLFDHVLVPLDGSRTSEAILDQLPRVIGRGRQLTLLNAIHLEAVGLVDAPESSGIHSDELIHALKDAARRYLKDHAERLHEAGYDVAHHVELGSPARLIVEHAGSCGATLIALATHGRTGLSRWVFGSTTERVLRAAPVPVLVGRVHEDASPADLTTTPARILLPTDGSPAALAAVPVVASVARQLERPVEVLVVVPEGASDGERAAVDAALQRTTQALADAGVTAVEPLSQVGEPASVIGARAASPEVLCVMSTHGRSSIPRMLLGSVTEGVLRQAGGPVIVVRGLPQSD